MFYITEDKNSAERTGKMTFLRKKLSALALAVSVMAGCTVQSGEESFAETAEEGLPESPAADQTADIDIFADNPNPAYTNVAFREEDGGAGEPQSYEDLQDFLDPDGVSFFGFRILGVYTAEEAFEITGNDVYPSGYTTLFKAKLNYDYLNNKAVDIDVNIAKAGSSKIQFEGSPLYEVGGEYAAYFTNMDLEEPRLVACPELLFTLKSDGVRKYALHPMFGKIDFTTAEGTSLDLGIEGGEISVITSTSNNPVKYVHLYDIEELAAFFREDWTARGYTFKSSERGAKTEETECFSRIGIEFSDGAVYESTDGGKNWTEDGREALTPMIRASFKATRPVHWSEDVSVTMINRFWLPLSCLNGQLLREENGEWVEAELLEGTGVIDPTYLIEEDTEKPFRIPLELYVPLKGKYRYTQELKNSENEVYIISVEFWAVEDEPSE